MTRLAVIVSHPIQYYVPLYRRLAARSDVTLKVFFTWHAAETPQQDHGFKRAVRWDIPLTEGYDYDLVPNRARNPGTHHFFGVRNPQLISRVTAWKPDVVHITGYALASHLNAIRHFHSKGIPVVFRGDSHLLDQKGGWKWWIKRFLLRQLYGWVSVCLYVGKNNYEYYQALDVPDSKLFYCPHSIEVGRFLEPEKELSEKAQALRTELKIPNATQILLFAGKFEPKKRPLELMAAVERLRHLDLVLLMVGNGELQEKVEERALQCPGKFRILPFQNQSRMPVIYRVGDILTLPSAHGETWGLCVNEAMASGRRALISDKVGCAPDLIQSQRDGAIFHSEDWTDFENKLRELLSQRSDCAATKLKAQTFDVGVTEAQLWDALKRVTRGKTILDCVK